MQYGITRIVTTLALILFSLPASAHTRHYSRHVVHYAKAHTSPDQGFGASWFKPFNDWPAQSVPEQPARRAARGGGLPGPCQQAARMGGPCGCWAEYTLFGRLEHVVGKMNMWLAADWLRFPRASSVADANAAVYLSRSGHAYHVAPIVAGVAHDSFGDHPVTGRVVLVRATI